MIAPAIPQDLTAQPNVADWPKQGDWTYDDYLRLPDDGRIYEVIEGVLYVNAAPTYDHQFTVKEITVSLDAFVKQHALGTILTAPFEVHLPSIARPVQPDVLFVPNEMALKRGDKFLVGAPKMVVEVLSPSTRRKDLSVKADAYERAGVQEYWVADVEHRSVLVFAIPEGGREYVQAGLYMRGETLSSVVFPELALEITPLFL